MGNNFTRPRPRKTDKLVPSPTQPLLPIIKMGDSRLPPFMSKGIAQPAGQFRYNGDIQLNGQNGLNI